MSAPETFLAYLAGKTTTLGIGHGVVCLPPAMNPSGQGGGAGSRRWTYCPRAGCISAWARGGTQQEAGTFGYNLEDLPADDRRIDVSDSQDHDAGIYRARRQVCADSTPADLSETASEAASADLYGDDQARHAGAGRFARHRRPGAGFRRAARRGAEERDLSRSLQEPRSRPSRSASARSSIWRRCVRPWCWTTRIAPGASACAVSASSSNPWAHWYNAGPPPETDDLDASEHEAALEKMSTAPPVVGDDHNRQHLCVPARSPRMPTAM